MNSTNQSYGAESEVLAHVLPQKHWVMVIVGERGEGKTTFVKNIVSTFDARNVSYTGFYAEGEGEGEYRVGYSLVLLPEKKLVVLSKRIATVGIPQKAFEFNAKALEIGQNHLAKAKPGEVVIIDEVGQIELNGNGWASSLAKIVSEKRNPVIITVRKLNLAMVVQRWNIEHPIVVDIKSANAENILDLLKDQ